MPGDSDSVQVSTSTPERAPTISVCICTRNRPRSLQAALVSLSTADELPDQVIVSDDGDGDDTRRVCREFPFVTYVRGPRRGLSANRNVAIREASGDYISFLDDDATVSADFVHVARAIIASAPSHTIFTGRVVWNGVMHGAPGARTFLGHFAAVPRGDIRNFHIACSNLFPRSAFDLARFDETIRFGYEEMDMADQLLAAGFRIEFRPELLNYHESPEMTADEHQQRRDESIRARFYVSIKHHLRRGRTAMVPAYAVVASVHEAAHRAKSRRGTSALGAFNDMAWALRHALRENPPGRRSAQTRATAYGRRWLSKPHYIFRPSQVLRRLRRIVCGGRPNQPNEITLPWGLPIRFREGHSAGSALARTGIYDLCVTETLYRLTDPGELAVDVGANIGYMTSVLAAKLGPDGKVLSLEPNPEPMALLASNVARWMSEDGIASITVKEAALSDRAGRARLHAPDEHEWSSLVLPEDARPSDVLDVHAHRLDGLVDEPIGVLKIDAEGAELNVLRGSESLLARRLIRDVIFEEHRPYPTDVTRFLEDRGFSVFRIGQALLGPRISAPHQDPEFSWDPPSYLATREPDRALALLRRKGWAALGVWARVSNVSKGRPTEQRARG